MPPPQPLQQQACPLPDPQTGPQDPESFVLEPFAQPSFKMVERPDGGVLALRGLASWSGSAM